MKTRWLDRKIAAPGPYLALCLSKAEFKAATAHLKAGQDLEWISNLQSQATAHTFNGEHGLTVVVCLRDWLGRDPVEIAGLLVHEAVHAWQSYADCIGERNPGIEQEAYAIQSIAQELMSEFSRRVRNA